MALSQVCLLVTFSQLIGIEEFLWFLYRFLEVKSEAKDLLISIHFSFLNRPVRPLDLQETICKKCLFLNGPTKTRLATGEQGRESSRYLGQRQDNDSFIIFVGLSLV
jgi:hypothetical protein